MTELLAALKDLALPDRIDDSEPLYLRETQPGSKVGRVRVDGSAERVVLRLTARDYLPLLNTAAQVRKLPDYLLFADLPASARRRHRDVSLQVVVCELKSGAAGAEAAKAQLRCGRLLARYLVGLAALRIEQAEPPETDIAWCGVVAVPQALLRKGGTKPEVITNREYDGLSTMFIHRVGDGGSIELDTYLL